MTNVERVHDHLRSVLLRGDLAPGTWIRQDDLADTLGVSKIPVREAMQRLAATGLLEFAPNRGVMVPSLTAHDAIEIYELRCAIEPILLERAIPRSSAADLQRATAALRHSAASTTEGNWAFHHALYEPSGWRRGLAMVESLHASVAPYVSLYTDALGAADRSDRQHRELLAAARRGDTDGATTVLLSHLAEARDALERFLTA